MRHLKIEFLGGTKTCWHDRDTILFFAMFQVLVDFVEKEFICYDFDWTSSRSSDSFSHASSEILDLYDWFIENSIDNDDIFDIMSEDYGWIKIQAKRLIDIMDHLWT